MYIYRIRHNSKLSSQSPNAEFAGKVHGEKLDLIFTAGIYIHMSVVHVQHYSGGEGTKREGACFRRETLRLCDLWTCRL